MKPRNTTAQYDRIKAVLEFLEDKGKHFDYAEGYASKGYSVDDGGIVVFADWNRTGEHYMDGKQNPPTKEESIMPRAERILEKLGCECEWSDEWSTCCNCNNAIRTRADCYEWTPDYMEMNGELECSTCIAEYPSDYFEELDGQCKKSHHIDTIDPAEHGYVKVVENYQRGMHEGMNDHPDKIGSTLDDGGVGRYFFEVRSSQFYVEFDLWVHGDEKETMDFKAVDATQGDVSGNLKRALQNAPIIPLTL